MLAAASAQAQSTTLVSNLGQPNRGWQGTMEQVLSQSFTTGTASAGYVLSSIEVVLGVTPTSAQRGTIRAQLWSTATVAGITPLVPHKSPVTSVGSPHSKIADLTVPSNAAAGTVAFAAPANTRLEPNTTYHVVFYTVGDLSLRLQDTRSDNEDAGSRAGWSVANVNWRFALDTPILAPDTLGWWGENSRGYALRMRVKGSLATTAVDGNMTVGDGGSWKGFQATPSVGELPGADFTYNGVRYRILGLRLTNSGGYLDLHLDKDVPRELALVLDVGGVQFPLADAVLSTGPGYEGMIAGWAYSNQNKTPPSWSVGDTVAVSLGVPDPSTVKLSVRPTVKEGSWVSVEACLSPAPQGTVRIPVTLSHGTSEAGDWGVSRSGQTDGSLPVRTAESIVIDDWFQSRCGSVNIPTHWDGDTDDETFTVALDTAGLPPGVLPGTPSTVAVTILDQVENARLRDLEMNTGN